MDKFYEFLAYKLPKRLVYFCTLRVAGLDGWAIPIPIHLRVTTALRRWVRFYEN